MPNPGQDMSCPYPCALLFGLPISGKGQQNLIFFRQMETWRTKRIQHFEDSLPDFTWFGMAAQFLLAEDQFLIDGYFKTTTLRRDQFPVRNEIFNFAFTQDLVRQTDGTRCVVSSCTVFNGDSHHGLLHKVLLRFLDK